MHLESKYEINTDYLLVRVHDFKSLEQDFSIGFIVRVHWSVPEMETWMVAPLSSARTSWVSTVVVVSPIC